MVTQYCDVLNAAALCTANGEGDKYCVWTFFHHKQGRSSCALRDAKSDALPGLKIQKTKS